MAGLTEERLDVLSTQLFKTFDTDEVGAHMTLSVYAHATSCGAIDMQRTHP
jgi:hypothetical protein